MVKRLFITVLPAFLLAFTAYPQGKVLLRYQPPQGLYYLSEYDVSTVISQEIMGIEQEIEMKMLMQMDNLVESVNESGSILSTSYKRLVIETLTPSGRVRVDTDSPEKQVGKEYLKTMTGKKFEVRFDKTGRVTEITGLEKIISEITAGITDENPAIQSYKNTLNDAFGQSNIKNSLNQVTGFFPDYPVGQGDSWDWEMKSQTAQFQFTLQNTSTVKEIDNAKVIIQTNSIISSPDSMLITIEGMDAKVRMNGKQVSEIYVNPSTGIASEGVIQQEINGVIRLLFPGNGQENLTIPIKIETRINLDVKVN